jgi:hypothetical protein
MKKKDERKLKVIRVKQMQKKAKMKAKDCVWKVTVSVSQERKFLDGYRSKYGFGPIYTPCNI